MARKNSSADVSPQLTTGTTEDVSMIPVKVELGKVTSWSYEILVATVSAISFSCLIATLREFDGQLQNNWNYRYVTRNTVIATMSTITRASLLGTVAVSISQNKWTWFSASRRRCRKLQELEIFDNASRGVAGSFQLLGTVKHNHIASLGALVTVLALGFDAFAQNILGTQYHDIPHQSNLSVGHVPRSEIYNASNQIQDWINKDLNFDMKAAISNGILRSNTAIPLPACSTRNWTWPMVPSLAMCGGCSDVTKDLRINCTIPYMCSYSLPDGMELYGPKAGTSMLHLPDIGLPLFNISSTAAGHVYSDIPGKPGRIYTARFSAINTWISNGKTEDSLAATECALWFCMQSYKVSILSGNRTETVEWDTATPFDPGSVGERNFAKIPPVFNISDDIVFGTTYEVVRSIEASISEQIAGNVTDSGLFGALNYSSDKVKSLWNARKDLDGWTKNLALAMTHVIRTNGTIKNRAGSNMQYAGMVMSTEAFVHVRWTWVVYPAAMLLLGWTHFAMTVWQTVKGSMYAWKGNLLIPLLLAVESDERGVESIDSDGRLSEELRNRRVILRSEEKKGWYFSNAI